MASKAFKWRIALKNDEILEKTGRPASEKVAEVLEFAIRHGHLEDFWDEKAILVPIPRSAPLVDGALWVPLNIAKAIVARGLADGVLQALVRKKAVVQAHTSYGHPRRPSTHHETVEVELMIPDGATIILIDDFITSGATALGCAWSILDAFPHATVKAFAGARILWRGSTVSSIYAPIVGTVTLQGDGKTVRVP